MSNPSMSLRYTILFVSASVFAGCGSPVASDSQSENAEVELVQFNPDSLPTVAIEVPAIHCDGCALGVAKCLKKEPGVEDVQVDVATKTATLAIDESLFDSEKAVAALTEAQFPESSLVKADANQDLGAETPGKDSIQ